MLAALAPAAADAEKVVYVYNHNAGIVDPGGNRGWYNHIRVDEPNGSDPYPIVGLMAAHDSPPEEQPRCSYFCEYSDPAISPDGQRIAVTVNEEGASNIWVLDILGFPAKRILDAAETGDAFNAPVWSPSGNEIFVRRSDGDTGHSSIEAYAPDGSGRRTVIALERAIFAGPVASPNGTALAYSTLDGMFTVPPGGGDPTPVVSRVPVASMDVPCGLDQATMKAEPCAPLDMAFSPSGQQLAFDAGGQIFTTNVDGTNTRQVTCSDKPAADPSWSGDGHTIAFQEFYATSHAGLGVIKRIDPDSEGSRLMIPDDGDTTYADISYQQPQFASGDAEVTKPPHCPNFRELLPRYGPELRYDPQESFYADSAAEMTDNRNGEGMSNKLVAGDGTELAWADHRVGPFRLSLDSLDDTYPLSNGMRSSDEHWIDADNGDYAADAGRMHANGYGDRIYGRGVRDKNGEDWLQYWFFYYHNPFNIQGIGEHEGDWEMIQVRLKENDTPADIVYAQHKGGELCNWGRAPKAASPAGQVPAVYVAYRSHASYHSAGTFDLPDLPFGSDVTSGRGRKVRPAVEVIRSDSPSWVRWPGHWGNSRGGGANQSSPQTPSSQGHWKDPAQFAEEARRCSNGRPRLLPKRRGGTLPVPAPKVTARRAGGRVVVSHRFDSGVPRAQLKTLRLQMSVDLPGDRRPPHTREYRTRGHKADTVLRPRIGAARATVLVSAMSPDGIRSRVMRVPVR